MTVIVRTITGTVKKPNNAVWANAVLRLSLVSSIVADSDEGAVYPDREQVIYCDANGLIPTGSTAPKVLAGYTYKLTLPDNAYGNFVAPTEAGDITIDTVIGLIEGGQASQTEGYTGVLVAERTWLTTQVANGEDVADKVNVAGDTMTGALVLPGNPSADLQAAPKQYVDAAQAASVPLLTGATAGNSTIIGAAGDVLDSGQTPLDNSFMIDSVGDTLIFKKGIVTGKFNNLLYDEFLTAETNPLTSPRTCEPGRGSLDITDTETVFSISSRALQAATVGTGGSKLVYDASTRSRADGLAFKLKLTAATSLIFDYGWSDRNNNRPNVDGFLVSGDKFLVRSDNTTITIDIAATNGQEYELLVICRVDGGAFWYLRGGDYDADWQLIWVDSTSSAATLYAGMGRVGSSVAHAITSWWVVPLVTWGFNWSGEYTAATATDETPTSPITLISESDFVLEFSWTVATGETLEIKFRQLDSANYWLVRGSQSDGWIRLYQVRNGSETQLSSNNQTWTDSVSYKIRLFVFGATARVFVDNTLQLDRSSMARFLQERNITASGFATGADLIIWKREITEEFPFEAYAANEIEIISPENYQVFQRSGATGDIAISGVYRGSPTAIEARFNGGSWATIDASPSGGEFSGTLSSQAEGQGILEVRFTNITSVTDSLTYIGIGDVFIVAGQSNASGRGTSNQTYSGTLKAGLFHNDYRWYELSDPTDDATGGVDAISQDAGAAGSPWPLVVTSFLASEGVPVAFVPCAVGGSTIANWQKGSDNDRATMYGSMQYRAGLSGAKAVLFHQGEADVLAGTTQGAYTTALGAMVDDIAADLSVPTIIANIHNTGIGDETAVNAAIAAVIAANANAYAGPDNSGIVTSPDTEHFTTNAELSALAVRWWTAMQTALGY